MSGRPHGHIILVAEDDTMLRNVLRRILETAGFGVLAAADQTEAVRISSEYPSKVDLLLTELRMRSTVTSILEDRPGIRVLIISSDNDTAGESPCRGFLQKPFQPADLIHKVNSLLGIDTVAIKPP